MERKEAIKVVRNIYQTDAEKEALETLIPELRESEDERIRKDLIYDIERLPMQGVLTHRPTSEYIAYLEKQKDASKAIEAVDRIDKYIDEHLANAHDMKDSNPDKKYYRGWDDALGKMAGILQDVYSDEKQKEQKPEERFEEAREKYQVEWSEEDESKMGVIIRLVEQNSGWPYRAIKEYVNWLKSLRPVSKESLQSHWKPSEEQMEAFRSYIKDFQEKAEAAVGGWNNFDVMIRLFEQLKKLM